MAEFCPACWNKLNGIQAPPEAYIRSFDYELCEGCGQWKRVVVDFRRPGPLRWLLGLIRRLRETKFFSTGP